MRRRLTGGEIHARAQNDIVHLALPTSLIEATPGSRYFLFSELNATSQSNLRGGLLECAEYLGPELLLRMVVDPRGILVRSSSWRQLPV
jgi:hypothetical protein